MGESGDPTRVLYLAGFGRSGSTILGNVLGQAEGWFHGGEIRNLWNDGWIDNRLCGCGHHFNKCPVWTAVIQKLTDHRPGLDPNEVVSARDATARTRQLPMWLVPQMHGRMVARSVDVIDLLADTYSTIASVTGASLIVDSTMSPAYGMLLASVPTIQLSVLHLTRDPRAVAYSWQREIMQESQEGVSMRRYSVSASTAKWVIENLASTRLNPTGAGARMAVTYEEFTRAPAAVVSSILNHFDPGVEHPDWHGNALDIDPCHSVWGNSSRFATGRVEIKADERWRQEMSPEHRRLVGVLTMGTRQRLGYR